jgi:hypothetical protein
MRNVSRNYDDTIFIMAYIIPLIKEYTRSPIGRGKDRGENHVINEGRPSQLDDCLHDDDDLDLMI